MEIHAINILYDFCIMSALLFIAKVIRTKVKIVQNLYIPASLLAGFLGLFCGKFFLNILPFSTEISSYSSILIAVLFASLFLGNKEKKAFNEMFHSVGDTFLVNTAAELSQYGVFILIGIILLPAIFKGIDTRFGILLPAGFFGGHGTAAAIGSAFADAGWDEATTIGQTFATIGLVAGLLIGVLLINIGTKKNYTRVIKRIEDLPEDVRTGLIQEGDRKEMGMNTVSPMSIDPLTWHLSLVLCSVGLAYILNMGLKKLFPAISFPVYGLALIMSLLVQSILRLMKLENYVDKKVITRIGSTATDYLVGFGIASININIVLKYWIPILVLIVLGIVYVILWYFIICKKFLHNYWFERGIYIFGMATGVMATGVTLLRITDPEFKTGVLEDFGFAWIFLSIIDMLVVSIAPLMLNTGRGWLAVIILLAVSAACLALSMIIYGLFKDDGTVLREGELKN